MTEATDIEIYIAHTTAERLTVWLDTQLDRVERAEKQPGMPKNAVTLTGFWQEQSFAILILEREVGRFSSLWLNSSTLPWADDEACAVAASRHFEQETRIVAGGWHESDDPDAWIKVLPDGSTTPFTWKTD